MLAAILVAFFLLACAALALLRGGAGLSDSEPCWTGPGIKRRAMR